jgi:hypothetical protein
MAVGCAEVLLLSDPFCLLPFSCYQLDLLILIDILFLLYFLKICSGDVF